MPSTALLRHEVAALADSAGDDLDSLWRRAETPAQLEEALRDVLPALIDTYGLASAAFAADWYDDLRAEVDAHGRFTAIPAEIPDTGAQALVGWALTEATDLPAFQTLILGGTQRRIANFSRLTVTASSVADPAADGWIRVGVGECEWCKKYLDGEVRTVPYDFPAHDHCNCEAVPAF